MIKQYGDNGNHQRPEKVDFNANGFDIENLFSKEGDGKGSGRFFSKLIKKDIRYIIYSFILYFFQVLPLWVIPLSTASIIDLVTLRPSGYVTQIIIHAVFVIVLIILNLPFTCWRGVYTNKILRVTTAQVKSTLVRKLQRLSITYHKEIEEGKIQSKFLRDMENVETYYRLFLNNLVPTFFSVLVSVSIAAVKNPIVLLFFIAVIPLNVIACTALRKKLRFENKVFRKENENLSAKITTSIQMLQLTKSHGLTEEETTSVNQMIEATANAGLKLDKTNKFFGALLWVVGQLGSISCLLFCVFLVYKDLISVGEIVLFQSLFNQINNNVQNLTMMLPNLLSGAESVRSLSEIMRAEELERDDGVMPIPAINGDFEFRNVSYNYPKVSKNTITDFNLTVKAGEKIAFVGPSGSGKTTIINLIIGLLSPSSGEIYVDGVPLKDMPMQDYRKFISVVPQNSILFAGTIRENITYGLSHFTEAQLNKAVEDSAINEFLPSLPNGLDTFVGEHGDKLSGGQKQRISIARALIRNPKILILDEATSALDNVSEYHIQKAIENVIENRTTFVVAHRLSTIRNADKIVVLENGKIVEVGSYDELVKKNGKFTELERLSHIHSVETESI